MFLNLQSFKKSIFNSPISIFLLVILLAACQQNPQTQTVYLDDSTKLYDPRELEDLILNQKISTAEQSESLKALQLSFKSSYVGYYLKKTLIGIDGDQIFTNCQAQIKGPVNTVEYYDLIRSCLSAFDDSHLNLRMLLSNASVTSVIAEGQWIGKRLVISKLRPQLIQKLIDLGKLSATDAKELLKVGSEVVQINNLSPQSAVHDLSRYISSSSPPARKAEATYKLFSRNYAYPKSTDLLLTLRSVRGVTKTITVPWVQNVKDTTSIISKVLLKKYGILPAKDYENKATILESAGFDLYTPLFTEASELREFVDETDYEILSFRKVTSPQKLCYIQLYTFAVDRGEDGSYPVLEKSGDQKTPISLIEATKSILQDCDANHLPIVLDLRDNGGGNARFGERFYMLFENSTTTPTYYAKSTHSRSGNLALFLDLIAYLDPDKTEASDELYLNAFYKAAKSNSPQTPWIMAYPKKPENNFFQGSIFITTGHQCVSACENFINRMKKGKRATVIGESTNGTGFGFSSTETGATSFRDPLNLYEINIPNHAFQITNSLPAEEFREDNQVKGSLMDFNKMDVIENRPVYVDHPLYLTSKDLVDLSDYRTFVLNLMF